MGQPVGRTLAFLCIAAIGGCGATQTGAGPDLGAPLDGGAGDGAGGCNGGQGCVAPETCGKSGVCLQPGTCALDVDCPPGEQCATPDGGGAKTCVPGGNCGGTKVAADQVPPNLLIVLDRSCSMTEIVSMNMTKWQIAVAALDTLTAKYKGQIRFGLTLFPDRVAPNCDQSVIPIPVGANNETAIQTLLMKSLSNTDPNYPNGPCVTPIDAAVHQATTDPGFKDLTRQSFALLLTDGEQAGCSMYGGAAGATTIITNLRQKQMVDTF